MNTIAEAKQFLRANAGEGVDCPCCGKLVKIWKHSINSAIARTLMRMRAISVREDREWIHIMKEINFTTMYGIARHWKLIEQKEHRFLEDDKKASGYWRLTQKGIDFVEQKISIPKYVYIFDAKIDGFSERQCTIDECLGKNFSYSELIVGNFL